MGKKQYRILEITYFCLLVYLLPMPFFLYRLQG